MNRIKDRKLWWAVNFGTQHIKAPDYLPMPGLGLSIAMVFAAISLMLLCATVLAAADSPNGAVFAITAPLMSVQQLRSMAAAIPPNIERKEGAATEDKLLLEMKETRNQLIEAVRNKADKAVVDAIQQQLDEIDAKIVNQHNSAWAGDTLEQELKENSRLQDWLQHHSGTLNLQISEKHTQQLLERKTLIDSSAIGNATSGIIGFDRTPGIVSEARQELRMRNVLSSRPTSLPTIDFIKVNAAPTAASLQTEGSAKGENAVTFVTASAYVKTIATWVPMTRQAMDDFSELMGFINTALPYYVNLREEIEFLHGGGGSTDILGLVPQASALQTALALPAYNKSDLISAAIQQIQVATEVAPTFVVLHPTDYWQILRTKDANRNYVFSGNGTIDPFWGLKPVITTKMGAGNFLVGSGSPVACEIRDRMGMEIAISTEHSTYFTENKIAVRAEKRTTLVTYRPGSYIFGTFTSSPA